MQRNDPFHLPSFRLLILGTLALLNHVYNSQGFTAFDERLDVQCVATQQRGAWRVIGISRYLFSLEEM